MKTIKNCSLYYQEGSSNKQYHIQLVQDGTMCFVNFQYGRIGNALQSGTKTPTAVSIAEAEKIYTKLKNEKTGKGYVESESKKNDFTEVVSSPQKKEVILLPQLLNAVDDPEFYIANDDYLAQEKKDGNRRMIISSDTVIGLNKKGIAVSLPDSIINQIKGVRCILDGEIIENTLFAFDLLSQDGKDLRQSTCLERLSLLALIPVITPGTAIEVIPTAYSTKEKRILFERLKSENREGIVFKKKNAPYTVGRPSSGGSALKFKFYNTGTFIVIGHTKGKSSIDLGLIDNDKVISMGKTTIPVNHKIPEVNSFVEIRYLYAFKNGSIFQSTFLNVREDCDLSDASITQLVYKNEF